jgi:hypothetical protein
MCNDCFHKEVVIDNERRAFGRDLGRALKQVWKELYLVPWTEDEDEDDEAPLDNVHPQTDEASSFSLSGETTCAHCGKGGNLNRCAKCKVTFYCSRSHQAADYGKHKANCQAVVNDTAQPTRTRNVHEQPCDAPSSNKQLPASSTWRICAHCGIKGDKLSRCARCKCTWYCSVEHQKAHYPEHKQECRMIADTAKAYALPPSVPTDMFHPHIWANKTVCMMNLKSEGTMPKEHRVISWRELERMHPNVATGRTLEVRLVSVLETSPGLLRLDFVGRDAQGSERVVAFGSFLLPEGLRKGCVLRWRNPWFHRFAHGGSGANIEHWDLPNVSISDGWLCNMFHSRGLSS